MRHENKLSPCFDREIEPRRLIFLFLQSTGYENRVDPKFPGRPVGAPAACARLFRAGFPALFTTRANLASWDDRFIVVVVEEHPLHALASCFFSGSK